MLTVLGLPSTALSSTQISEEESRTSSQAAVVPFHPQPILIEADTFKVLFAAEKAVWEGNVVATQGNYTFHTSVLTIHLDQVGQVQNNGAGASADRDSDTKSADQFTLSATSLNYDLAQDMIVGDGDSELRRGLELIRADKITYWVTDRVAIAAPDANGRVFVQFYTNPQKPVFPGSVAKNEATTQPRQQFGAE